MADEQADHRRMLRYLMLAVLIWGSLLALGVTLFGFDQATGAVKYSPNLARGAIVEGCVLCFLACWWWLVARRE